MHGRWRLLLLLVVMAGVAYHLKRNYRVGVYAMNAAAPVADEALVAAPAPALGVVQTTVAPPAEVRIADSAAVTIASGTWAAFPFNGNGRSECRVRGTVRTLSGGSRRVNVLVVDREGMADLEAGRSPRTYYESGAVAEAALDLKLDGRTFFTLVVRHDGAGSAARTVQLRRVVAACSD